MSSEPQEIEVEVVEVTDSSEIRIQDQERAAPGSPKPDPWRGQWTGRISTLNMKWWPLWSLVALILLLPLLLIALVIGACLLVLRLLSLLFRGGGSRRG